MSRSDNLCSQRAEDSSLLFGQSCFSAQPEPDRPREQHPIRAIRVGESTPLRNSKPFNGKRAKNPKTNFLSTVLDFRQRCRHRVLGWRVVTTSRCCAVAAAQSQYRASAAPLQVGHLHRWTCWRHHCCRPRLPQPGTLNQQPDDQSGQHPAPAKRTLWDAHFSTRCAGQHRHRCMHQTRQTHVKFTQTWGHHSSMGA